MSHAFSASALRTERPSRTVPTRWRRPIASRLLALLLAFPLSPAVSSPAPGESSASRIVREQSAWLAERTDYREPALPGVHFESQAELQHRCFPAFPEKLDVRVRGAYDPAEGNIYLDVDLDLESHIERSYLLHELVHHFQVRNRDDTGSRSRGRLEGEAYRLQLRWLAEAGVDDPLATLGIDEKTLQIIERSPR